MPDFADTRLPYHLDGTRVFHRISAEDSRSVWFNLKSYTEFTPEQRERLNEDRRHAVSFYATDTTSQAFPISLYGREVTFFFPVKMTLTGIFLATTDDDRGFNYEYQTIFASVSPDTTALDDGTWHELGWTPVSSQFRFSDTGTEIHQTRVITLIAGADAPSAVTKFESMHSVAWDADQELWGTDSPSSTYARITDGIGIVPLYGEDWSDVQALRLRVDGTFDSIGRYVSIHLYGQPTDPDDAGITYERSDGEPLVRDDLDFGNVPYMSGPHILGPFRIRNTTDRTASDVVAKISGTVGWGLTEVTNVAYTDEFYSLLMPYVQARIGGGAWQSSPVSGKHIPLVVGDLAPGEVSDDIEVKLDYNTNVMPMWSRTHLALALEIGTWV